MNLVELTRAGAIYEINFCYFTLLLRHHLNLASLLFSFIIIIKYINF